MNSRTKPFFWPVLQYQPPKEFSDAATADMRITELQFEVHVNALLPTVSQSTMTMTFKNDHPKILEGELQFTLPPDSTVCGYGVDIGGEIVDGVPIEKQKAKVVFEKEVRKKTTATPSIVEMVTADIFKTRIYPLPANGTRTVRLSFETQVSQTNTSGDSSAASSLGEIVHVIPATISKGIENLNVKVNCVGLPPHSSPRCEPVEGQNREISFEWQDEGGEGSCGRHVGELQKGEGDYGGANTDFKIIFPQTESVVAVENMEGSDAKADEVGAYFCISDVVLPPGNGEGESGGLDLGETAPASVCVVWDASLSRDKPERSLERDILISILSQDDWKDVEVTLVELRDTLSNPVKYRCDETKWSPLADHLKNLAYDGATNLGAVNFKKSLDGDSAFDFYILFSDGMANMGREEPAMAEVPVYCVNSGGTQENNHSFLTYLSEKSGGKYYDISSGKYSADNVAQELGKPSVRFLKAEYNEEDISLIPPISSSSLNSFTTVGLLKTEETTLKLSYGYKNQIVRSETHTIKFINAIDSGGIVRRMWAKQRIAEMMPFPEKYKNELTDVGKKFGIVTPGTSFIVLETLDQHLEHDIVPSRNRTKLYDAYMAKVEGKQEKKKADMQTKIGKVKRLFNTRNLWFDRDFSQAKTSGIHRLGRGGGARAMGGFGRAPPGARSAPPTYGLHGVLAPVCAGGAYSQMHVPMGLAPPRPPGGPPMPGGAPPPAPGGHPMAGGAPPSPMAGPPGAYASNRGGRGGRGRGAGRGAPRAAASRGAPRAAASRGAPRASASSAKKKRKKRSAGVGRPAPSRSSAPPTLSSDVSLQHTRTASTQSEGKTAEEADDSSSAIQIQAWDPNTPYIDQLKGDGRFAQRSCDDAYKTYLDIREHYEKSPSFYFDVSNFFEQTHKNTTLANRILTNVLELSLDNAQLLRTVGYKLVELGLLDSAAGVFEKVLRLRPEEPQSYRDLALVLSTPETAGYNAKRALRLFDQSIIGTWDSRFDEIELVCLMELAHAAVFTGFEISNLSAKPGLSTPNNLVKLFDVDLRISLAWDTDETDVDLHVIEPTGEECDYSNRNTRIGGSLSRDFTRGLGPEEYILKKARPGKYTIKAKYFANHRQSLTGATTLLVTIFKRYGDKVNEEKKFVSVRLSGNKQLLDVATVQFP